MESRALRIDVAGATGLAGAELAATLHLPGSAAAPRGLLACLHGGGYTRRYWHPRLAGFPGYSFAEHMTGRGHAVLALDLLGMGESSRPEPESRLSRALVAAASHAAVERVRRELGAALSVTGIGHSIGGMMAITQQAAHRSFDRLAVLGWSNQPMRLGELAPETLARSIRPGYLPSPRREMRALFYASDVPLALIEADEAIGSTTPACLGRDALLPGIVHEASAAVDRPVFLGFGAIDTSPDAHCEVPFFAGSRDVTLFVLERAAHCHNLASTRRLLWDRLDSWIAATPAG